jgi:hypothetical protein
MAGSVLFKAAAPVLPAAERYDLEMTCGDQAVSAETRDARLSCL